MFSLYPAARGRTVRASCSTPTWSCAVSGPVCRAARRRRCSNPPRRRPAKTRRSARSCNDPYTLTPDRGAEPELGGQPDAPGGAAAPRSPPELRGDRLAAFAMAMPNSRIVRRSNALLDYGYGRRMAYGEQMSVGTSLVAPVAAGGHKRCKCGNGGVGWSVLQFVPRWLVERIVPKPGTGPSEQTQTTVTTESRHTPRPPAVSGIAPPWPSRATPATRRRRCCLVRAHSRWRWTATTCRKSSSSTDSGGGGMGDVLLNRLPAAGVTLEVERLK